MVKIHSEKINSVFKGTIIDIETIGNFRNEYKGNDSRRYSKIIPVIFGFINKDSLNIFCAKNEDSIKILNDKIKATLPDLKKPFYAFNSNFERGSLFHQLGIPLEFRCELNKEMFESKRSAVLTLKIPNYNDPFNDNGELCKKAWLNGNIDKAITHNRGCLLKERDILLKRGFRKPDELRLIS